MKFYFLRHGQANWEHWERPDDERPLTKRGRKEMEDVASALTSLKVRPQTILTSPLPRAFETAQIVAEKLDIDLETTVLLAPGFGLHSLRQILNDHPENDLMFVGHEPDFSLVLAQLTGGTVRMAKAGIARVDIENAADLRGELVWLIPPKVLKEIERMAEIIVGCALSDVNRGDLPRNLRVPERLADYIELYQSRLESPATLLELQPEDLWTVPATFPDQFIPRKTNRWWRTVQSDPKLLEKLRAPGMRVGVHQPLQNRDALSSNFFHKYEAIEATKQAMEFAEYIDADYFVFHLAQVDKWAWNRQDQMEKAIKIFNIFATYYTSREMSFVPVIETLEFPKFPATGAEAFLLLKECRKALRNTKMAFNLAHLWSSRNRMLATGHWPDERVSFEVSLEYALDSLANDIYVYHLSGGWESETHSVPGLHPQQDPFRYPIKLRESSSVYAEMGEMDLNRVLELLVTATTRRGKNLDVVLQIFDRDIEQVLEAGRLIRHDLVARANAPAVEYRPFELATPARKRKPKRRTPARIVPVARAKKNGHSATAKKNGTAAAAKKKKTTSKTKKSKK